MLAMGLVQTMHGEVEAATDTLDQAISLAQQAGAPVTMTSAATWRATLREGDVELALDAFEEHRALLTVRDGTEVNFLLWGLTHEGTFLDEAKRLLDHLVDHAPEEYRDSMLENVRFHREIIEAWAEHGEKTGQ